MAGDIRNISLKPKGWIFITDPSGGLKEFDCQQCVHCQKQYPIEPGSGKIRGYCYDCRGPICSERCSRKCVHWEQVLDNIEHGRPEDYKPIMASVPRLITE